MSIKFGTSGWRAIIADEFTFDNVEKVVRAIAGYVRENNRLQARLLPRIIVGYDTRFLSREFAQQAAEVLAQNGIAVFLADRDAPTPVIAYHIIKKKTDGGINFTASHNPPEYNGIKFSPAYGGPAPKEVTNDIEQIIARGTNATARRGHDHGVIKTFDAATEYISRIKKIVNIKALQKAGLRVVVDCMHGTCRGYLDAILEDCADKLWVLNKNLNPLFGGHPPEPKEGYIRDMIKAVTGNRAHLGLACDGDADRFGIVDHDGAYITANQVICVLFEHLIKTRGKLKYVARSMSTTHLVDRIARNYGIAVRETPVGFKYIGEILSQGECLIGGEESGGLSINGHVPEKDGILACLLMAEVVAVEKKSIKNILANLYKKHGYSCTDRIDAHIAEENKAALVKKLRGEHREKFCGLKVKRINDCDGHKFILEDESWVMYRFSGTEPLVRCYLEAASAAKLKKLRLAVKKFISDLTA